MLCCVEIPLRIFGVVEYVNAVFVDILAIDDVWLSFCVKILEAECIFEELRIYFLTL
jgi:hypothetical protein